MNRRLQDPMRALWVAVSDGCLKLVTVTSDTLERAWHWFTGTAHSVYGLAIARILMGVAVLGETSSNFTTRGYSYGATWTDQFLVATTDFADRWPWEFLWRLASEPTGLTVIFIIVATASFALALGLFTRTAIVALLLFWVGLSELTPFTADQSDNLIRISLTMLLFARCDAVWSVAAVLRRRRARPLRKTDPFRAALHNAALIALAAQVCFIYAAGGLYKAGGQPWAQGWAIYDPLHVKQFSNWPEIADLVTTWGPGVALATTLTVLVQTTFPVLLLRSWTRRAALLIILGFHIGIGTLMGLPWFSVSALAVDAVFIREETWMQLNRFLHSIHHHSTPLPATKVTQ